MVDIPLEEVFKQIKEKLESYFFWNRTQLLRLKATDHGIEITDPFLISASSIQLMAYFNDVEVTLGHKPYLEQLVFHTAVVLDDIQKRVKADMVGQIP